MPEEPRLELLCESHAGALYPLLLDADLWTYTDGEPPLSQTALAERYRALESRRSPDGSQQWLNWAVIVDAEPIGFVQATVTGQTTEIAYVIGRAHQGRGYATRAVRAMLEILKERYSVLEARATVDARNEPSLRLLARIGFEVTDTSDPSNVRLSRTLAARAPSA